MQVRIELKGLAEMAMPVLPLALKLGKVVEVEGVSMCRLPAQGAPARGGRGAPAVPQPDEK